MKEIIADNKWLVGWRKECQNWSKRYWKGGRRIKDLELPKTVWSMYYMSLALITVPRVGNLAPLPLSMTDTVIIRKTCPADCVHVCLHTCICVSGIHRVERKETQRKMKVWGHLPFFSPQLHFNDSDEIIQIWFYFVFCFFSQRDELGRRRKHDRQTHTPWANTVKSVTTSLSLALTKSVLGAPLPQGTHNNVLRISFLNTRGGTDMPLCDRWLCVKRWLFVFATPLKWTSFPSGHQAWRTVASNL